MGDILNKSNHIVEMSDLIIRTKKGTIDSNIEQ